jgi:hypothetical protein
MKKQQLDKTLAGVSALAGVFYAMKKKADFGQTALYVLLFGAAGFFIGNGIKKYTN